MKLGSLLSTESTQLTTLQRILSLIFDHRATKVRVIANLGNQLNDLPFCYPQHCFYDQSVDN